MTTVIYGKHPAFGDFLTAGLEPAALTQLEAWVQPCLTAVRDELGEGWETAWDTAPPLRVWIGADVLGVPLMGIWVPSWDKVGRRYPLIVGVAGYDTLPPIHPDHDEGFYVALEGALRDLDATTCAQGGVQGLIEGIAMPQINGTVPQMRPTGMIWGQRADGDLSRLMRDARDTDAARAQLGRSHWWYPAGAGRDAGWMGTNGLPDARALRWLMAEVDTDTMPAQDDDGHAEEGGHR